MYNFISIYNYNVIIIFDNYYPIPISFIEIKRAQLLIYLKTMKPSSSHQLICSI